MSPEVLIRAAQSQSFHLRYKGNQPMIKPQKADTAFCQPTHRQNTAPAEENPFLTTSVRIRSEILIFSILVTRFRPLGGKLIFL